MGFRLNAGACSYVREYLGHNALVIAKVSSVLAKPAFCPIRISIRTPNVDSLKKAADKEEHQLEDAE